jgi:uncharacterized protein (TIRG00374 family)
VGVRISFWESLRVYYMGGFAGLFLPPTVGGDVVRAALIRKEDRSTSAVVSSIVVERVLGLGALLFLATTGVVLFTVLPAPAELDLLRLLAVLLLVLGVLLAAFALSLRPAIAIRTLRWLDEATRWKRIGRVAEHLASTYRSYASYDNKRGVLVWFFMLSCLETVTIVTRSYVVALALGVHAPFIYFLAFVPVVLVLTRLPLTVSGFGLHEGGFVYFLSLVGVPASVGFSTGVLNHVLGLLNLLPGGVLLALSSDYKAVTGRLRGHVVTESNA